MASDGRYLYYPYNGYSAPGSNYPPPRPLRSDSGSSSSQPPQSPAQFSQPTSGSYTSQQSPQSPVRYSQPPAPSYGAPPPQQYNSGPSYISSANTTGTQQWSPSSVAPSQPIVTPSQPQAGTSTWSTQTYQPPPPPPGPERQAPPQQQTQPHYTVPPPPPRPASNEQTRAWNHPPYDSRSRLNEPQQRMYPPPPVPPPESPDMRSSRRRWESSPSPDHLAPAINFHELVNSYHRILEGARTDAPVDRMLQNASYGAQVLESANIPAVVPRAIQPQPQPQPQPERGRIEAPRPIEPPQPPPQPERKRTPPPRRLEPAPPREKPVLSPVLAEAPSALSATSSVLILSNLKKGDEFIHTVPGSESTTPLKSGVPQQCLGCQATSTPEWRRGPMGPRTLCNACGLVYAKLVKKRLRGEAGAGPSGSRGQDGPSPVSDEQRR
ncbi:unnamed protein product [Mycena citricolor]|uniref:GATA-type domain-containing protein n=1 Tax=Mycena citricolor TaxID=2018698 RepID=A0AAD2HCZ5_9AGAR|nr:unnamed protein product [Mycena citricolor]CAK5273650.1 unnamed protein product [Mycena citricolor]